MSFQRQLLFWFIALFVFIVVLWVLSPILLPFIAGLVLAYFLDPIADALERSGMRRSFAATTIIFTSILGFVALIVIIGPILSEQLVNFAQSLPSTIEALIEKIKQVTPPWVAEVLRNPGSDVPGSVTDFAGQAASWMAAILASLWSGGLAIVNIVSLIIITPIVAFYLLIDWDRMIAKVDMWLPRDHVDTVRRLAREIDQAMAGFIRGQAIVCIALGIFYGTSLTFAGLNFGLVIGLMAGLLSFIPYVGALLGGIAAIGVALVQFLPDSDYGSILLVTFIFAFGQFIEGNFLSPKLVGGSVGLHPVWLMFALFVFGYLFGFVGLLLAVPLAAAAGVFMRFGIQQYMQSKIYRGQYALGEPLQIKKAKQKLLE